MTTAIIDTTEGYVRELITPRPADTHKGRCGRVLIVAGSRGMAGAALLCGRAALLSGAGLVTFAAPRELFPILQTGAPEAMCMDRDELWYADLNGFDAIAVGPGMGNTEETYRWVEHILMGSRVPVVVDADGINSLCAFGKVPERRSYMDTEVTDDEQIPRKMGSLLPDLCRMRKGPVILTPHPGEADRILDALEAGNIGQLGREKAAGAMASKTGAVVVLKGSETLIADGEAKEPDLYRNTTGNPGMATGGSGDVLTGVIAALAAYGTASASAEGAGLLPLHAARLAVWIHGMAGDLAAEKRGEIGMTSMDIAENLPEAFRQITGR